MSLIRYEPATFPFLREMEDMSERFNRFIGSRTRPTGENESLILTDWMPAVDIQETETEYLLKAELPEVKKEDVAREGMFAANPGGAARGYLLAAPPAASGYAW